MKGRMRPYLPELTIRDYNTYMRYLRGVRRQMYKSYGFYACHLLRTNGVLFAILSDSLAGRMPTCKRQRMPGTPFQRSMMCQTLGIRQAAQTEIPVSYTHLKCVKFVSKPAPNCKNCGAFVAIAITLRYNEDTTPVWRRMRRHLQRIYCQNKRGVYYGF